MNNNRYIIVTGAMNWKRPDRTLKRSQIFPIHIITPEEKVIKIPFFQSWGKLGIGSIVWDPAEPLIWYLSTGENVYSLNLETLERNEIHIGKLAGVHELSILKNKLWVTNTQFDEVICYNYDKGLIEKRIRLSSVHNNFVSKGEKISTSNTNVVKKFHCNQVFIDYEGRYCCLIHHASGTQIIRKIVNQIIKRQGNGGILYLDNGISIDLGLSAPHNVRLIGDQYWVLNSGTKNLHIYNRRWQLEQTVTTKGWGRGTDVTWDQRLAYIGISATRKRYIGINNNDWNKNSVLEFKVDPPSLIQRWNIPQVEQVNSVILIPENVAQILLALDQ